MKKLLSIITSLFLFSCLFSADLNLINITKIRNHKNYDAELAVVSENQNRYQTWISDDLWHFTETKEDCREILNDLYSKICANPEPKNQEYLLLKASISDFLYNLDEPDFFDVAVENYNTLEKLRGHDYRCEWFKGVFYANSAKIIEGYEFLENVVQKTPEKSISPYFYYDLAMVANVCSMPATSLYYYEKYAELKKIDLSKDKFYLNYAINLYDFNKEDMNLSDEIRSQKTEDRTDIFIRPFGLLVSSKNDWTIRNFRQLTPNTIFLNYGSSKIQTEKTPITYSVMVSASLEGENFGEEFIKNYCVASNLKPVNRKVKDSDMKFYEYKDPSKYTEVGGAHLLFCLITKDYTPTSEKEIESPVDITKLSSDSQVHYYQISPSMRRSPTKISYMILLDTCEDIFKESSQDFYDFIENSSFK